MDDIKADILGPPHGTAPAVVIINIIVQTLEEVKTFNIALGNGIL